jgi:carbamoyl-phosphate synthase large subunit
MKAILVTGIGGVVGQGILRNLRAMTMHYRIVGINTVQVSAGNHFCDYVHQVPFAVDPGYIAEIQALVHKYSVALVIPSTDYEAYHLALHAADLPCRVAAPPAEVAHFCLDKYMNFRKFSAAGLPFARSILPSDYRGQLGRVIVKPREGRGSRNIVIDPPTLEHFDDQYVVQEYLDGPELTTAFYVLQSGDLHGLITMQRELEQGNTARCEVVFDHDEVLSEMVLRVLEHFPFRGSFNIQSRVTANGIIPFEINCRISGTNSIRAQLGFNDVAYTVQELLLKQMPSQPKVVSGSALRIIHDIVYPGISLSEIKDRSDKFFYF